MNKIEKYILLTNKARFLRKNQKLAEARACMDKVLELDKTYRVEDLVADFDSIGYKVNIKKLTEELLRAKEIYEQDGWKFDNTAIGSFLLSEFADAYEERRGR